MIEYTVKQIAELLGVSKPTVQKAIKELAISPEREQNNNRRYYNYADTVAIIKLINKDFDFSSLLAVGEKPPTETAKPQTEPPKTEKSTEKPPTEPPKEEEETAKPPNSEEVELLKSMLAVIQEQLKEKDNQLAIKDKQIQDLSDRLAEAMQLTKAQQYITAADKTVELIETDIKREEEPKESIAVNEDKSTIKKKGFWQRIFGK